MPKDKQNVYRAMLHGLMELSDEFLIPQVPTTDGNWLYDVFFQLRLDHPEIFWAVGSFVAKIHAYVPFTYTVDAFRATISGGRSITSSIIVMVALLVIFTILTILQFNHMTKRKKTGKIVFFDWLEERGLA